MAFHQSLSCLLTVKLFISRSSSRVNNNSQGRIDNWELKGMSTKSKLDFSRWYTIANIPAFKLTKASAKFEVATSNRLAGDAFTREYIISLLPLSLGHGHTRNVAQYPLHHMTYASAKFEAAMSNGLGGNAFTRNI